MNEGARAKHSRKHAHRNLLEVQLDHLFQRLEAPLGLRLLQCHNLLKSGQRGCRRVLAQLFARVVLVLQVRVSVAAAAIAVTVRVLLTGPEHTTRRVRHPDNRYRRVPATRTENTDTRNVQSHTPRPTRT
jgi:hypothetical protein